MKKTIFIKNAAILTASSLILRFVGIVFKVWLASAIGSEGIGLYQLVFSVYVLAATFATSGICTAVTRLVADELALGSKGGVVRILRRCLELTLLFAAASTAAVYFGADFIAGRLLSDMRAAPALKILAFSLPFMGIASCLRGYFIARRKASPSAFSQLLEQAVRIVLVLFLVRRFMDRGLAYTCGAVLFGDTAAEFTSVAYLWLLYLQDKSRLSELAGRERPPFGIVRAVLHISLPITAGRYLNSALRTIENILVPKTLSRFNSSGNALSQFGMIKGMALPILFFPSTLLNSLSTLLIPEMSEANARGRKGLVRSAVTRILQVTGLLSFIFSAIFLTSGRQIGTLIYGDADVGFLLCALSPIVPLMYLDSVSDGILKGLDQQIFTFRTGVFDSALRILLVWFLLPKFGLMGFIGIMYGSNLLTCCLNVGRLIKVSRARLDLTRTIFLPIASALSVTLLLRAVLNIFSSVPDIVYIITMCGVAIPIYIALLFIFKSISRDDLVDIIKH